MASGKKKGPGSQNKPEYRGGMPSAGSKSGDGDDPWLFEGEGERPADAPAASETGAPVSHDIASGNEPPAPAEVTSPEPASESVPAEESYEQRRDEAPEGDRKESGLTDEPDAGGKVDISEEFSEAAVKPKAPAERRGWNLTRQDLLRGGIAVAAVAIIAGYMLKILLTSGPVSKEIPSDPKPDLPVRGDLVTIKDMKASWRERRPGERVGSIEAIGAQDGKAEPGVLPQVKFTVDSSASKTGFVRFLFYTSDDVIAGNAVTAKVEGGRITPSDDVRPSGEGVEINCTQGILNENAFRSYLGEDDRPWRIEVSESADYAAPAKDWKVLARFDIGNELERN